MAQLDEEKEIAKLRDRIESNRGDVSAMVRLGALMFEPCHRSEEALRWLKRAIQADPGNVEARFWLAKCLYHDYVDVDGAARLLDEALRLDPSRADCLSFMASVLSDLGAAPEERIELLERAVDRAPDWPTPRQQLAEVLMSVGRLDEAERRVRDGLMISSAKPISLESVEQYYESAVTGRAWPTARQELEQLLDQISRRRAKAAATSTGRTEPQR